MALKVVTDPKLKEEIKDKTLILGRVRRHVLATIRPDDAERRQDVIHPSELSHADFCPRECYYRLAGFKPLRKVEGHSYVLRRIFDEGHDIGIKFQNDLWDMGELLGMFHCQICASRWWGKAPKSCVFCNVGRQFLRYLEVPVDGMDYLISGSADGRVGDALIENKSIGKGTIRLDNPVLWESHVHKIQFDGQEKTWEDHEGMWRAIKLPFPTHMRQGQIYLHFTGLDTMVFIYECKWNQQQKEFVVKYQERIVEPMLEMALDIKYALKKNIAPDCPFGGCPACKVYEEGSAPANRGRITTVGSRDTGGEGRARKVRVPDTGSAGGSSSEAPEQPLGDQRRRADSVDDSHELVDGSYCRIIGSPRDRRKKH